MSFILDIDLDYFGLFRHPIKRLDAVLHWARRPIDVIVQYHHEVLGHWDSAVKEGRIDQPTFILHIDEHHDMLGEQPPIQFGNFLYFGMLKWPACRVHWLTKAPIDYPDMWLSEEAWQRVASRFTSGARLNANWPKPDFISVCTSPGFVEEPLRQELLERIAERNAELWSLPVRLT
jgi:hypothetical protein